MFHVEVDQLFYILIDELLTREHIRESLIKYINYINTDPKTPLNFIIFCQILMAAFVLLDEVLITMTTCLMSTLCISQCTK